MNSLPNDKIFDLPKLKAFLDDTFRVAEMVKYFFDRVKSIVGKGENAGFKHFLLLTKCFKKAFF